MATGSKNSAPKDVTVQDLSEQLAILKDDMASLTSTLGDYTREKGMQAKHAAKAGVDQAASLGRAKAHEAQVNAEDFIRTQPATALGIAAGLGFLVGMITARR